MSEPARRAKRYPIKQGLALRCDSWGEFIQFFATDISQGGLFVVTDEVMPLMTVIDVRLQLPEGHLVALSARVVHVLDPESAKSEGKQAGIGVEFIDLDEERKEHIHQLVEFARWEGISGTGTYASHLFEHSPRHQTLDEIVLSLPAEEPDDSQARKRSERETRADSLDEKAKAEKEAEPSAPRPARKRKRRRRRTDESRATGEFPKEEPQAKPSDPLKLKEAMTHFARRRYKEAILDFKKMNEENPGDVEANKWMAIAEAHIAIADKDEAAASAHYQRALRFDENNHEARRFVREYQRNKKLKAIPFGRLFTRRSTEQ